MITFCNRVDRFINKCGRFCNSSIYFDLPFNGDADEKKTVDSPCSNCESACKTDSDIVEFSQEFQKEFPDIDVKDRKKLLFEFGKCIKCKQSFSIFKNKCTVCGCDRLHSCPSCGSSYSPFIRYMGPPNTSEQRKRATDTFKLIREQYTREQAAIEIRDKELVFDEPRLFKVKIETMRDGTVTFRIKAKTAQEARRKAEEMSSGLSISSTDVSLVQEIDDYEIWKNQKK